MSTDPLETHMATSVKLQVKENVLNLRIHNVFAQEPAWSTLEKMVLSGRMRMERPLT